MKFAREKKKRTQSENWQQPKKDIKLKVVKSELQDFQFISNFIFLSFSFSWVFFLIFFLTNIFRVCGLVSCMLFSYSPLTSSTVIFFFFFFIWWDKGGVGDVGMGWCVMERKTNKIIYCLSICVIFFDYNSHISIIFFIIQFCPAICFLFIGLDFFLSKWTYQCKLTPGFFSLTLLELAILSKKIWNEMCVWPMMYKSHLHIYEIDQLWMMVV